MNALVPKNADHVIGVLSGWDRLVFRGTLRMLAYPGGMAAYLSRIGTLLKDFRRSRSGHDRSTHPSLLETSRSGGTPRPLPSFAQRSQGRLCPADRPRRRRCRRTYLRPDVRRAVSVVRGLPQPRKENPRNGREEPQMQVPLPLLDRPAVRLHVRARANLVSLLDPSVHEWSRVARATDRRTRHVLRALRQQLPLDRGFSQSPEDVPTECSRPTGPRRWPPLRGRFIPPTPPCFAGWGSTTIGPPSKRSGPPTRCLTLRKPSPRSIRNWSTAPMASFDSRNVMRFLGHRFYEDHQGGDRQRLPQPPRKGCA